jgi:hypothetical protein
MLEFDFGGSVISSQAPDELKPGDRWPGPHPGLLGVLCAGGRDIRYQRRGGNRVTEVRLSDEVDEVAAKKTSSRIAELKGTPGGRFYINKRCELFGQRIKRLRALCLHRTLGRRRVV